MLTKIAEKLGILDLVAPWTGKDEIEPAANTSNDATRSEEQTRQPTPQEARDEALARKLQAEEDRRLNTLKAQKEAEDRAEKDGLYAKRQRVLYVHRGTDKQYDAMVVGVHFDDGPDKPYYTIKYKKIQMYMDDDGIEKSDEIIMEKQTTPDRLTRLPWDENETWEVIR